MKKFLFSIALVLFAFSNVFAGVTTTDFNYKYNARKALGQGTVYAATSDVFNPSREAVKCSRKMSEEDIKEAVAQALAAASTGVVHISPFISNGEKKVRDALLKAGYPIIVLVENGLTRYSKPAGEMFNTCALGKLLVLSPWEYHTSKSLLNREKCTMLNEMAAQVAHLSAL